MQKVRILTPYPSMKTVARELGVTDARVNKVVRMVQKVIKGDSPANRGGDKKQSEH